MYEDVQAPTAYVVDWDTTNPQVAVNGRVYGVGQRVPGVQGYSIVAITSETVIIKVTRSGQSKDFPLQAKPFTCDISDDQGPLKVFDLETTKPKVIVSKRPYSLDNWLWEHTNHTIVGVTSETVSIRVRHDGYAKVFTLKAKAAGPDEIQEARRNEP